MNEKQIEAAAIAINEELGEYDWDSYANEGGRDTMRDIAKSALEAASKEAWQDISEAPRDGTPVLLPSGNSSVQAYYNDERNAWYYHEYPDDYNIYEMDEPTHFQHLPKHPKE